MASKFFNALLLLSFLAAISCCSLVVCMGGEEEIKYFPLETEAKEVETTMVGLRGRMMQLIAQRCNLRHCCSDPADPSTCQDMPCCFGYICDRQKCHQKVIACNCDFCST